MPSSRWDLLFPLLAVAASLSAQTADQTPVQQLRANLLRQPRITVVATGLHASTRVLIRPVDNRVLNGAVQLRPMAGFLRGSDDRLLQPGEIVHVQSVESSTGEKNDVLRLVLVAANGAQAPVAFLLPPNTLDSTSEAQLQTIVASVLSLPASALAGRAAVPSRPARTPPQQPPPPATGWIVQTTPTGRQALLTGTAEEAGRKIPVGLALSCSSQPPSTANELTTIPAGTPLLQLRVRGSDMTYDLSALGEKDGDDNAYMHLQIGSSPEGTMSLSVYSVPGGSGTASLVPTLRSSDFRHILQASGAPLRIGFSEADIPAASRIVAHFELPADAAPASAVLEPCVHQAELAEAALQNSYAVSCPVRPGMVLVAGDVRFAQTRKLYPVEPDRDQAQGWALPKPTRAHPTVPRLILACGYAPPSTAPASSQSGAPARKAVDSLDLPIPAKAAGGECETWLRVAEDESTSHCSGATPASHRAGGN